MEYLQMTAEMKGKRHFGLFIDETAHLDFLAD